MAEVTTSINARVPATLHARLTLASHRLNTTNSELVREAIESKIAEYEARADAADREARNLASDAVVNEEMLALIRQINEGGNIEIRPTDYKGAKGKAVLRMLALLWGGEVPPWASSVPEPEDADQAEKSIKPKARASKKK